MKFYKLALWKSYFDMGYGITSYIKYFIAFFGLASQDVWLTLIIGVIYGISCFVIGWIAYRSGFVKAQAEVGNQYNLFVKQMRKGLKTRKP